MAKTRKVDSKAFDKLVGRTGLPDVGATLAHPDMFPTELGIGRRPEPRNKLLGTVITRPEEDTLVFGLNYFDAKDSGDNEDMFKLDVRTLDLEQYMRGLFEREYPEYAGTHRAGKPFLRKLPSE